MLALGPFPASLPSSPALLFGRLRRFFPFLAFLRFLLRTQLAFVIGALVGRFVGAARLTLGILLAFLAFTRHLLAGVFSFLRHRLLAGSDPFVHALQALLLGRLLLSQPIGILNQLFG